MKKTLHKFTSQLKWWIGALALFASFSAFAQSSQMKGSVQDEKGQPLIGVSVILKESANAETRGTTSDIDGNYIFNNLREGSAYDLTFSYIGYEKQVVNGFLIRPATENKLDIKLNPSSANLEEVVVTALGVKKEVKRIGYAVQEVKGEDLVKARDSNPITGLTGKVAGLSVAMNPELLGSPSLLLRGNQISLYVVDGVPISSDTWNISPDDI